jgi:hypothetical protein
MRAPRVSIAQLLWVVLFSGVALAALRSASDLWAALLFTLTATSLLVAVLGAVYRPRGRRAFWLGFALFGWAYLLLGLVPEARSQLATTRLLDDVYARVLGRDGLTITLAPRPGGNQVASLDGSTPVMAWEIASNSFVISSGPRAESFRRIGNSLFSLLFALLGGLLARRFHAAGDRPGAGMP